MTLILNNFVHNGQNVQYNKLLAQNLSFLVPFQVSVSERGRSLLRSYILVIYVWVYLLWVINPNYALSESMMCWSTGTRCPALSAVICNICNTLTRNATRAAKKHQQNKHNARITHNLSKTFQHRESSHSTAIFKHSLVCFRENQGIQSL